MKLGTVTNHSKYADDRTISVQLDTNDIQCLLEVIFQLRHGSVSTGVYLRTIQLEEQLHTALAILSAPATSESSDQ